MKESCDIAELYLSLGDWGKVRDLAQRDNLIRSRTTSSSFRVCREICQRLGKLNDDELKALCEGTIQVKQQLLWLAICRSYKLIYEFAVEVVREKFLQLHLDLRQEDYDAFFNAKAEWHDELENLAESTRKKLRQVVFKMLREADLLTKADTINMAMLTPQVALTISKHSPDDLRIFPLSDRDIRELLP